MGKYTNGKLNEVVGANISRIRKSEKITQGDLADYIGLTRTSMVNIEKGRQSLSVKNLYEIAYILGVDITDILPPISSVLNLKEPADVKKMIEELPENKRLKLNRILRTALGELDI